MQELDTKIIVPFGNRDYEFLTRSESGYDVTVTDKIVIREIFVENVYRLEERHLDDTGIVVDIGGNIGAFSIYAVAMGAKKVLCFEPDSFNLDVLRQNVANNKLDNNIFISPVGIFKESGSFELVNGQGASFITGVKNIPTPAAVKRAKTANREFIDTVTLEEALNANSVTYADVLKIDCEGSEYEIINSTSSDVLNKFRYITMEFHIADDILFGQMVAKLTKTHKVETLGSYERGGQIYAERY